MGINLKAVRDATPGCRRVIHFNNAGASLMPRVVYESIVNHLTLELNQGGYEAVHENYVEIESFYQVISKFIDCNYREIAFIESATRAWDMIFYSINFCPDDYILTSIWEYSSNYVALLQRASQTGAKIEIIPNDETGQPSIKALKNLLKLKPKLITMTHVPTNNGIVNPVSELAQLARENKAYFLLDASQSIGQIPISVKEIDCDFLTATGRKYLRGPRGTGFLFARYDLIEKLNPPFLDVQAVTVIEKDFYEVRSDARRFEQWEANFAAKMGLKTAVQYALDLGMDNIWERTRYLGKTLRLNLCHLPGVELHDLGDNQCGIVTFTCQNIDSQSVYSALREKAINVSVSGQYSSPLDMQERRLKNLVRASVHYYNSEEEIAEFCKVLSEILL